jgi:Kef-type K+ transport system membrane component KefB
MLFNSVGGIILGPTVLSRFPAFKNTIFPTESLPKLQLVAEVGLILYLFLVGMELDPVQVIRTFRKSASISITGILLPFCLGMGSSKIIYDTFILPELPNVTLSSFIMFCGVASIQP